MNLYTSLGESIQRALENIYKSQGYVKPLVIYKFQNAPEPKKSYVAISILSLAADGRATKSATLENVVVDGVEKGRFYHQQHYTAQVQLSFIGEDSGDMSLDLKQAMAGSVYAKDAFGVENLALRQHGDIRHNPQLRETRWVDSFNFDLSLGYSVSSTEDVDWVAAITVNGIQIPDNI